MSNKIVLQPAASKRQPLLKGHSRSPSNRVGEVVGGATAECAAVVCCCPCGLANFLVLAIFKVPAGLCRRAMRKKRQEHLSRKGLLMTPRRRRCSCGCDDTENQIQPKCLDDVSDIQKSQELDKEALQLEKEMWDRFYSAGFWRSPSQRESSDTLTSTKSNLQVPSTWEITNISVH